MKDDLRAKGTIMFQCSGKCGWDVFVDCIDPRLPDGPIFCDECDTEACALAEKRLAQDLLPLETA